MTNLKKWIGIGLLVVGTVVVTQYVRAAGDHASITATAGIDPQVLTVKAGPLPVTEIDAYF